jgi:hypothetical protein
LYGDFTGSTGTALLGDATVASLTLAGLATVLGALDRVDAGFDISSNWLVISTYSHLHIILT